MPRLPLPREPHALRPAAAHARPGVRSRRGCRSGRDADRRGTARHRVRRAGRRPRRRGRPALRPSAVVQAPPRPRGTRRGSPTRWAPTSRRSPTRCTSTGPLVDSSPPGDVRGAHRRRGRDRRRASSSRRARTPSGLPRGRLPARCTPPRTPSGCGPRCVLATGSSSSAPGGSGPRSRGSRPRGGARHGRRGAPAPLAAALGPTVGALTVPWYDEHGVRLLHGPAGRGRGRLRGVRLVDGTRLQADVVLAAVGARPTTAWLAGALPREPDGALRVDEGFAVLGAPRHVRAVGDVTLRRSRRHGWVPGGHWDGALRDPAELVADLLDPGGAAARPTGRPTSSPPSSATSSPCSASRDRTTRSCCAASRPPGEGWTALWYRPGHRRTRCGPHGRPTARRRRGPAALHGPGPARPRPHPCADPAAPLRATPRAPPRAGTGPQATLERRQCAKCRVPVRYSVTPAACAAATTSSSRTDPPGWTTARTPASRSTCSPSANGKNASEAATAPRARSTSAGVRTLDREAARVDAVDLPHPDADRRPVVGEQDRVGLHRTHRAPGERQVGERGVVGGRARRQRPRGRVVARRRRRGRPPAPADRRRPARRSMRRRRRASTSSSRMFFLRREDLERLGLEAGRDDDLGEHRRDLLRGGGRERAVGRDDAAERGDRVARVRLGVGVGDVGAHRDAARVGVLDDRDGGVGVVVRGAPRGVGVDVVVVAHRLAVQLLRTGQARGPPRRRASGRAPPAGAGSRRSAAPRRAPTCVAQNAGKPESAACSSGA